MREQAPRVGLALAHAPERDTEGGTGSKLDVLARGRG
jgi:hypothetical protein